MANATAENQGSVTVTVRHHKRPEVLEAFRAIDGVRVAEVDTSFGAHTIVRLSAPAARCANGLREEIRRVRGVIAIQAVEA